MEKTQYLPKPDLIFANPPCETFSIATASRYDSGKKGNIYYYNNGIPVTDFDDWKTSTYNNIKIMKKNKKEYFDKESVPKEKCDCHVRCKICKASGHLAGDGCPSSQIYTAVYLQKNESTRTADSSLSIPRYLVGSTCKIHN